ncbi:hypothetical protein [Aggregatibacter sp.]
MKSRPRSVQLVARNSEYQKGLNNVPMCGFVVHQDARYTLKMLRTAINNMNHTK